MQTDIQSAVVSFLNNAASYPHPVNNLQHLETHISHLFLTGDFAYKLKKSVRFDFLDFSTPEKRQYFCAEEIRLNSRYAPELYLELIPVSLKNGRLILGPGEAMLDHVIKMIQFDEHSLFHDL